MSWGKVLAILLMPLVHPQSLHKVESSLGIAEILAVCAVNGDSVSCRRPDGTLDAKSAFQFLEHWRKRPQGLPTYAKSLNRYVLVRLELSKDHTLNQGQMIIGGAMSNRGSGMPTTRGYWDMETAPDEVKIVHVTTPLGDKTPPKIPIIVVHYGTPAYTELNRGNSVGVNGTVFTIGGVQAINSDQRMFSRFSGQQWSIAIGSTSQLVNRGAWRFRALDGERKPFGGVDMLGTPVEAKKVVPIEALIRSELFQSMAYAPTGQSPQVSFHPTFNDHNVTISLTTNVDPRFFKVLEIIPVRTELFELTVSAEGDL